MDESLSDFQVKKNLACVKSTQKTLQPSTSKAKPKKNIKKIHGQRDIRAVLKKKNELISYYNDFDKICKQSGIDVDPEQLQLAIALSKSLQETETKVEEKEKSLKPLTAQEITGKVRTTLQEYGFVVPEVKITAKKTRKVKKYRKNYKLLQTTEAEKQQVISDKYSQVLFQNLDNNKEIDCSNNKNESTAQLYHLGTNISYEKLKDNSLLYVEDLLEKSPSFVGCLLKDWAKIPGRPVSPTAEPSCTKFDEINCTQEELDVVLGGLIKAAQDIVKNKHSLEKTVVSINKSENCTEDTEQFKMDTDCIEIIEKVETVKLAKSCNKDFETIDVENSHQLTVTQKVRSCSPDIFDDEVTVILDNSNQSMYLISHEHPIVDKTKHCAQIMDSSECININSQTSVINPIPQLPLSQGNQTIKRKSNDFMDITECVVGSSQAIRENVIIEENIDLTQNSDEDNVRITISTTKKQYIQEMDLTQSSDTNEDLPEVQISGNKSLDETIILNEDAYTGQLNQENGVLGLQNKNNDSSLEKLNPTSNFSSQDRASITLDSEDEIDSHIKSLKGTLVERAISPIECFANHHNLESGQIDNSTEAFNMTENHFKSRKNSEDTFTTKSKTKSFFDEFEHRHSESSSGKDISNDILCVDESSTQATNNSISDENSSMNKHDGIDLTQDDSDTSEEVAGLIENSPISKTLYDSDKMGKIGDVSIDYDELFDDLGRSHNSPVTSISSRSHTTNFKSHLEKPSTSDLVLHSSQNSEAFEISDKELDYSINKSRLLDNPKHNFDFGGISLVDNLPDLPSFRPSTNNHENLSFNRSLSESHLPAVEVKSNIDKQNKSKSNSTSPCKLSREQIVAKTPKNGEYIVKTNDVTPMIDYERLSTPEMNAELDKYGLRPFKRKRAIQLLTHLYNQTHPVVESLEIDPSSPFKRFKPSTNPKVSPIKRSPKKPTEISKAQKKVSKQDDEREGDQIEGRDKENDIYVVTSEDPDIRDIECREEDWVFQKREKAKLISCPVPLHVSFHNYVSSRHKLRDAILRYEPVNIDDIHKGLVASGFRYDPKDLLKFMDKKCITVKTADNSGRNKKHY